MHVLVLGGNGFIGSHVVDSLLASGHKVRVFDRGPEMFRSPLSGVEYKMGVFSDVPMLAEALEGVDVVYHLISTTLPSSSNLDPIADVEGNLLNTIRLLQLMVQKNIKRIIYLSSGGTVYGIPKIIPIPETHSLNPICSYGVVKVAVENYLMMFQSLYGIEPVVLRVSNPYGERQGHQGVQGVVGTFICKAIRDEEIVLWGDGSVVRDFIYVSEVASCCVSVLDSEVGGIFNVGRGEGVSIRQVIECIEKVSGKSLKVDYRARRGFDIPRVELDISKARDQFDWESSLSLEQGIRKTWSWAVSSTMTGTN